MIELEYFVHENACVDDGVSIGKGTKIWHFCHFLSGTNIGSECFSWYWRQYR